MRILLLSLFLFVAAGCSGEKTTVSAPAPEVETSQQAVSMPDTFAADAAMAVLNEGGNAVDAAIGAICAGSDLPRSG